MAGVVINYGSGKRDAATGTSDPRWVRWLLTSLAVGFLLLFVIIPAVNVFAQAFSKGWETYGKTFYREPLPELKEEPPTFVQLRMMPPAEREAAKAKWDDIIKARDKQRSEIDTATKNRNSIWLTLCVAAIVVPANAIFGLAAAWAVAKFRFRGRTLLISLIDLPFSVSPVVSGLIFVLIFGAQGVLRKLSGAEGGVLFVPVAQSFPLWAAGSIAVLIAGGYFARRATGATPATLIRAGAWAIALGLTTWVIWWWARGMTQPWNWAWLSPTDWTFPDLLSMHWRGVSAEHWWPIGIRDKWEGVMFTPIAIVIASAFVTFPFVARTLIPVMEANGSEEEVAALSLGARPWQMFWRITVPNAKWGLLYGVILCLARTCGEFGAVSVVTGNRESADTMPLRIEKLWNSYNNPAAFSLASVLTLLAVMTLSAKALIEWRVSRVNKKNDAAQKIEAHETKAKTAVA